jgi:lysozyme
MSYAAKMLAAHVEPSFSADARVATRHTGKWLERRRPLTLRISMRLRVARGFFCLSLAAAAAAQIGCSTRNEGESSRGETIGTTSQAYTKDCDGADSGVYGVDVYDGTGVIDWARAKAGNAPDGGLGDGTNGETFAFIKATQGDYTTESTFADNWANAKKAGILRSAYHFFDGADDGVAQANYFLSVVGSDFGELPAMLDIECPTADTKAGSQSNCEGFSGASGFPTDGGIPALQAEVLAWLDTVEKATGRKPIVYSYVSWFDSTGVTDPKLADYPLFISNIETSCPDIPAPWTAVTFWQYQTTGGTAPGIDGDCDLDRWMGNLASLQTFAFGTPDAGPTQTDAGKAAFPDAGNVETDAGSSTTNPDGAPPSDGGCGCIAAGSHRENVPGVIALGILGAAIARRRRSKRV